MLKILVIELAITNSLLSLQNTVPITTALPDFRKMAFIVLWKQFFAVVKCKYTLPGCSESCIYIILFLFFQVTYFIHPFHIRKPRNVFWWKNTSFLGSTINWLVSIFIKVPYVSKQFFAKIDQRITFECFTDSNSGLLFWYSLNKT